MGWLLVSFLLSAAMIAEGAHVSFAGPAKWRTSRVVPGRPLPGRVIVTGKAGRRVVKTTGRVRINGTAFGQRRTVRVDVTDHAVTASEFLRFLLDPQEDAADVAVRTALEHSALVPRDVDVRSGSAIRSEPTGTYWEASDPFGQSLRVQVSTAFHGQVAVSRVSFGSRSRRIGNSFASVPRKVSGSGIFRFGERCFSSQ